MFCCSPDFTHPEFEFRQAQIKQQKRWIDMADALGASYCRVLSGQRRPGLSIADGIKLTVECINECLYYAAKRNVTLILENHYKDDFWQYPEFAQKMDIFCDILGRIENPLFGVNYDPSNAFLAGEDPLEPAVGIPRVCDRGLARELGAPELLELAVDVGVHTRNEE